MNLYHLGALAIAALMVLACGHSNHCTADSMDKVIEMAKTIAIGVIGNAGVGGIIARKVAAAGEKETPK